MTYGNFFALFIKVSPNLPYKEAMRPEVSIYINRGGTRILPTEGQNWKYILEGLHGPEAVLKPNLREIFF